MPRTRRLVVAVALVATATVGWAPPGHAAAYRYWTYWTGDDGTWTFASAGPASLIPADGSVQGWRFAVTTQAGGVTSQPRSPASFDDVCVGTPAQDGKKRVALVIDPGEAASAPSGQQPASPSATCVVADEDATGYQVLRSVATVRVEGGLVCGIDGYPTGECAPVVDDPEPTADASAATSAPAVGSGSAMDLTDASARDTAGEQADDTGSGTPWALVGVLAVVAVVAGLLVWRRPRG